MNLKYFIDLGQSAYDLISRKNNDIYSLLATEFISLMAVLQSFRPCSMNTLPLELHQIWGVALETKLGPFF